ncbi:LytTR family two component transcriptional regulator [Aquimarina sp. MAR_2010_214]|uniref:LytR/AlgR family response regulator transcription factor n=1 Tax=Aquimarina sp. MAR_2010_214 TaxID=1250026 RepID=UPI000C70B194|nr:LytTR family DNA-binding domain-containing protein [Aquimarina sp. MAR_2010_214]PKV49874.1 LytTR family two component transcriptional regulator [Aquimarina sp. MAR_2010_214]
MKLRCIIVDDEQIARNILKKYIGDVSTLDLIGEFKNALEVLDYIQNHPVDVMFLDIEMPKLSGLNLAKIIENKIKVVFTTAHREFALEGFDLSAVDYLLKPFSFDRFLKAIQKINPNLSNSTVISTPVIDHVFVKADKKMVKINFSELLYIEGLGNYVKIHTIENTLIVYEKMSDLVLRLPSLSFMRIHRSYIINTKKIKTYTKEYVEIKKRHIPISLTYRNSLLSFLEKA